MWVKNADAHLSQPVARGRNQKKGTAVEALGRLNRVGTGGSQTCRDDSSGRLIEKGASSNVEGECQGPRDTSEVLQSSGGKRKKLHLKNVSPAE